MKKGDYIITQARCNALRTEPHPAKPHATSPDFPSHIARDVGVVCRVRRGTIGTWSTRERSTPSSRGIRKTTRRCAPHSRRLRQPQHLGRHCAPAEGDLYLCCSQKPGKKVKSYVVGDSFGELALMYNQRRAAVRRDSEAWTTVARAVAGVPRRECS